MGNNIVKGVPKSLPHQYSNELRAYIDKMLENTDGIDDESSMEFFKYWTLSKFLKLSKNNYIEKLAIKNDFDPYRIPIMSVDDIRDKFGEETFIKIEDKFVTTIVGELKALSELSQANICPLVRTYMALTSLANIEVRLDFLSLEALIALKMHFRELYGDSKDVQMLHAKKLLLKKEEEFYN